MPSSVAWRPAGPGGPGLSGGLMREKRNTLKCSECFRRQIAMVMA